MANKHSDSWERARHNQRLCPQYSGYVAHIRLSGQLYPWIAQWFYYIVFLFNINRFFFPQSILGNGYYYMNLSEGYKFHFPIYRLLSYRYYCAASFYFIMEVYKI